MLLTILVFEIKEGKNAQNVKETMSTTMHLFTFYLESDGMSTNNDYKHFFGALSLQFC
jgi:hypothetical protein